MSPSIDLVRLGAPGQDLSWAHGRQRVVEPTVGAVAAALEPSGADAVLCLDATFPPPPGDLLARLLGGPCDAWHAGLRLGLAGHPRVLDHVNPKWMLTTPVDPEREVTSPLVSLRAVLVRRSVLEQLGGPDPAMDTLAGAGIDLGIRWTRSGALVRHVPTLVPPDAVPCDPPSPADGFRCIVHHHGRRWGRWALARSVAQREASPRRVGALHSVVRRTPPVRVVHYDPPVRSGGATDRSVSVILPTIDRYPYLEALLHQLAEQTIPPHEVLVVDQTPRDRRRDDLEAIVPSLPVTVRTLDRPGQSTARNLALAEATGEFLLFIDDDDEIESHLLADHLDRLVDGIDGLCGGVDDATAGPPPPGFRHRRASDVFPTNNTMLRRRALVGSGLFDPTFDRGPRADRDLGVRLYLAGAVLVYDPSVMVFHHHAPMGGLRAHGARVMTRAGARRSLTKRNLPSVTETYLGLRYYSPRQRREAKALRILSILSGGGSLGRRAARATVQLVMLPDTVIRMGRAEREAEALLADRPPIPSLGCSSAGRASS